METEDWFRNMNSFSLVHLSTSLQLKEGTQWIGQRAQLHQNSFQYMPEKELENKFVRGYFSVQDHIISWDKKTILAKGPRT